MLTVFIGSLGLSPVSLVDQRRLSRRYRFSSPLVLHEREIRVVPGAARALLAPDLAPLARIDRRETRLARRLPRDFCDEKPLGQRHRLGVDLAPAGDDDFVGAHDAGALGGEFEG